jgi:hypothetical protein
VRRGLKGDPHLEAVEQRPEFRLGQVVKPVRYPEIPVVFADSRKFAEEWTYRFLAAALSDAKSRDSIPE